MAAVRVQIHAAGDPVQSDIGERLNVSAFIAPGIGPHQVEVRIGALNVNGPIVIVDAEDAVVLGQQLIEVAQSVYRHFGLDEDGNVIRPQAKMTIGPVSPTRDPDARMGGTVAISSRCHCGKDATAVIYSEVWGDEDFCEPHARELLAQLHGKAEATWTVTFDRLNTDPSARCEHCDGLDPGIWLIDGDERNLCLGCGQHLHEQLVTDEAVS